MNIVVVPSQLHQLVKLDRFRQEGIMLLLVPGSGSQDFCTQRSKQTVITNCHEAGRS